MLIIPKKFLLYFFFFNFNINLHFILNNRLNAIKCSYFHFELILSQCFILFKINTVMVSSFGLVITGIDHKTSKHCLSTHFHDQLNLSNWIPPSVLHMPLRKCLHLKIELDYELFEMSPNQIEFGIRIIIIGFNKFIIQPEFVFL